MPRRTIHVREHEVLIFDTIPNRTDWLERVLYEEIAERAIEPLGLTSQFKKPIEPSNLVNPAPVAPTQPTDPITVRAKLYPEVFPQQGHGGYLSERPAVPNEVHQVPEVPPMHHIETLVVE